MKQRFLLKKGITWFWNLAATAPVAEATEASNAATTSRVVGKHIPAVAVFLNGYMFLLGTRPTSEPCDPTLVIWISTLH